MDNSVESVSITANIKRVMVRQEEAYERRDAELGGDECVPGVVNAPAPTTSRSLGTFS